VLLAALSTGHKIGLGLVGGAFVGFALASAFLIPAFRPGFPGRRGLPAFLTLTVALFVGMMFAVFFFGREPSESKAAEGGTTAAQTQPAPAPPPPTTSAATSTASTSTAATTTAPAAPKSVSVGESEWKIDLPSTSLSAGSYTFDVKNDGHIPHDLTINGPGVDNKKTPLINPGKTAQLSVDLKSGSYDFYCSVPGHKAAGMDVKVTVS
jgi:uncharacterized cupredoxin-like copper-binding protein